MTEIHPTVRTMMERAAPDAATLKRWVDHHEALSEADVDELGDIAEREAYLDEVGWEA